MGSWCGVGNPCPKVRAWGTRRGRDGRDRFSRLGVDFKTDKVADDKQWRVIETFVPLVELLVGILEVAALGFVIPCEVATLPYVGKAGGSSSSFRDALFVGVARADLVELGGEHRELRRGRESVAERRNVR